MKTFVFLDCVSIWADLPMFNLIMEIILGASLPVFAFIGPALLDLFTRESYGRFKVVLVTDLLLIISAFIYSFIHIRTSMVTLRLLTGAEH